MRNLLLIAVFLPALLPCTSQLPVSRTLAQGIAEAGVSQQLTSQANGKDVAVTSVALAVYGPPFVLEGTTVAIAVGVSNNGDSEETFTLELRDDTENKSIDSQDVTLAGGSSTTVNIDWDTTGATGGPPPPGPPTPGTVHALTATASLTGDTDESNNSASLPMGIWVIAAPKPEPVGITFPEKQQAPDVRLVQELASDEPPVNTEAEALTQTYVSPASSQQTVTPSAPAITTDPTALTQIFNSPVAAGESTGFSKPEINTIAVPVPEITADDMEARKDLLLAIAGVATAQSPMNRVFLHQAQTSAVKPVSPPEISAQANDLAHPFVVPGAARESSDLATPGIDTDTTEAERIVATYTAANVEEVLAGPGPATVKSPLKQVFLLQTQTTAISPVAAPAITTQAKGANLVVAFMKQGDLADPLAVPEVATPKTPLKEVFLFQPQPSAVSPVQAPAITTQGKDAKVVLAFMKQGDLADALSAPGVATAKSPLRTLFAPLPGVDPQQPLTVPDLGTRAAALEGIFWTPVLASLLLQGTKPDLDSEIPVLLEAGTVHGRVRLQGRDSSLGSYVEIGDRIAFADRQGSFVAQQPTDNFDLTISAPGYLSVTFRNLVPEPEGVLVIPTVTLPFGDGDGNGVVDIYDIALAAMNFGESAGTATLP